MQTQFVFNYLFQDENILQPNSTLNDNLSSSQIILLSSQIAPPQKAMATQIQQPGPKLQLPQAAQSPPITQPYNPSAQLKPRKTIPEAPVQLPQQTPVKQPEFAKKIIEKKMIQQHNKFKQQPKIFEFQFQCFLNCQYMRTVQQIFKFAKMYFKQLLD